MTVSPPTPPADAAPSGVPVPPAPVIDNRRAILWLLLSVVTASMMTLAVRGLSYTMSPTVVVFLRAAFTLGACVVACAVSARFRSGMRFSQPGMHLLRGTLIGFSTLLGFYTIAKLELATVTVLFFMAPVFATLLNMFVHREKVGPRRWAAICLGFFGACIILRPGFGAFHPAMLAALASSFMFALALSFSRGLAQADGPIATYVSSVAITVLVSAPFAVPVMQLPETPALWALLAVLVVTGAVRGVGDIQAYRLGEASVLAPVTYLRLVIIGGAAYFLFDEIPDLATIVGAVVIIASTLYIALREARLRRAT